MKKEHFLKRFFFPSATTGLFIRIGIVAAAAVIIFGYICIPLKIKGRSMEPTYHDGDVNCCWRLTYLFSSPKRHDIMLVRFAGQKIMLLKRVVAFEGETVEFRKGMLFINGSRLHEPYLKYPCNWNLSPRTVKKGRVYVIGDNRNVPIHQHDFGQTPLSRIIGTPLW